MDNNTKLINTKEERLVDAPLQKDYILFTK